MNSERLRKNSVVAMFCAVAFLMTFLFRFKVSFLTFDFKDAIISIAALLYGPLYGVFSAAVVAILEFLSVSDTGLYGLLMNFISSGSFALICGTVYKYRRNFSGAVLSVVSAAVGVTAIMMVANIFITPFYMGVTGKDVVAMIPTLLLPFNLCKTVINAACVMIIYKPVTTALKKAKLVKSDNPAIFKFTKKTAILWVVSALVILSVVLFLIYKMGGSFQFFK